MCKDDCASPIHLVEHFCIAWVPKPSLFIAGENSDSLSTKNIAGIFDFAQASVNVRQRYSRKSAEAAWISPGQVSAIFIAAAGGVTSVLRVAKPDSRRGKRDHGNLYAVPVHLLERLLGRPFQPSRADKSATRRCNPIAVFGKVEWRHNVMMEVDQAAVGALWRIFCHAGSQAN